jgi:hypothetical protein
LLTVSLIVDSKDELAERMNKVEDDNPDLAEEAISG